MSLAWPRRERAAALPGTPGSRESYTSLPFAVAVARRGGSVGVWRWLWLRTAWGPGGLGRLGVGRGALRLKELDFIMSECLSGVWCGGDGVRRGLMR